MNANENLTEQEKAKVEREVASLKEFVEKGETTGLAMDDLKHFIHYRICSTNHRKEDAKLDMLYAQKAVERAKEVLNERKQQLKNIRKPTKKEMIAEHISEEKVMRETAKVLGINFRFTQEKEQ